jgi:hypothetical protein
MQPFIASSCLDRYSSPNGSYVLNNAISNSVNGLVKLNCQIPLTNSIVITNPVTLKGNNYGSLLSMPYTTNAPILTIQNTTNVIIDSIATDHGLYCGSPIAQSYRMGGFGLLILGCHDITVQNCNITRSADFSISIRITRADFTTPYSATSQ